MGQTQQIRVVSSLPIWLTVGSTTRDGAVGHLPASQLGRLFRDQSGSGALVPEFEHTLRLGFSHTDGVIGNALHFNAGLVDWVAVEVMKLNTRY
jgi:hypothetical protein